MSSRRTSRSSCKRAASAGTLDLPSNTDPATSNNVEKATTDTKIDPFQEAMMTILPYSVQISQRQQFTVARLLQLREISPHLVPKLLISHTLTTTWTSHKVSRKKQYRSRAYSGEYSEDGSLFYATSQDFKCHIYRTSDWKEIKTVRPSPDNCRWTLTDACMSPDNSRVAVSTISPIVHLESVDPDEPRFVKDIDFGNNAIWSIQYSADGKEIIGGASGGGIYAYDLEADRVTLAVDGHEDDVNSVNFVDPSKNVIVSGSDDSLVKVWDRRSMDIHSGDSCGVFVGHTEGITCVTARNDGRYCLSNGKDQCMKLWDLRMMMAPNDFDRIPNGQKHLGKNWDYRFQQYPGRKVTHPHDNSIQTYADHAVLFTLIRCRFSPLHSTGGGFVYTGSADGRVVVYSLDGRSIPIDLIDYDNEVAPVIRDVSWHPFEPTIIATTWSGSLTEIQLKQYDEALKIRPREDLENLTGGYVDEDDDEVDEEYDTDNSYDRDEDLRYTDGPSDDDYERQYDGQ